MGGEALIAWIIVIAVLLLILTFPVGVDAAYGEDARFLKLKLGPFRKTLLPGTGKKKKKKKKKKPKEPAPEGEENREEKKKKKPGLTLDDILTLAEIALDALHRFRVHLSVDRACLLWRAAASDPYDAVMQFGRVNAILGIVEAKLRTVLKIRQSEIRTELDLTKGRPDIEARLILSIQIWEILLIALCAGIAALRWLRKKKRMARAAAACA